MENNPIQGSQYRIELTGFTTPIRLAGGTCKAVLISAKVAIAGLTGGASVDNTDVVLVGVGGDPTVATAYVGQPIMPGQTQIFNVSDASLLRVAGVSGDAVSVALLF